ncbi:hypothetical protein C5C25_00520 [Rathayibacter sp. AY2B9]|nr:hypothetical protein C5C25_00520 [Rathayibacter sp. AY2B9]
MPTVTVTTTVTATATVTATPRPSTPTPAATAAAPVSTIPSPDAQQEALLRSYLNEVDPALVNDERVVNRSRDTCTGILDGQSEDALLSAVKRRFEEPPAFEPTDDQAAAILAGIRASGFCVGG